MCDKHGCGGISAECYLLFFGGMSTEEEWVNHLEDLFFILWGISVLTATMADWFMIYTDTVHYFCPQASKEGIGFLEPELHMVVSHCVGEGNWTLQK